MKSKQVLILALVALSTLSSQHSTCFAQGSLTPPGAPAPTMKTLSQIEPRTPISSLPYLISSSGAYYVTANLTGVSGSGGITITANDVTLDLCGFTLTGVAGSLNGISAANDGQNYVIRNGTLVSWGVDGVNAYGGINCRFERLQLYGNTQNGLQAGTGAVVGDCVATANTLCGFTLQTGEMSHCVAGNNATGIETAGACVVADCTAFDNSTNGFNCADGSVVRNCASRQNGGNGVVAGANCKIVDCTTSSNYDGIIVGNNSTVNDCVVSANFLGISAGNNCTIIDCNASENYGFDQPGIVVASNSSVIACTASLNGVGIQVAWASTVKDCTASDNFEEGIFVVSNACLIAGNTCSANQGNGLYIGGKENFVDGNNVSSNAYGIFPDFVNVNNRIVRNSATGNWLANYYNTSGNTDYGPTGGTPSTATSPWANF